MKKLSPLVALVFSVVLASSLHAEEPQGQSTQASQAVSSEIRIRRFELHPQITIQNFNTLTLGKNGHDFEYDTSMRGLPVLNLNFSAPLGSSGDFDWFGIARVGYGTKYAEVPYDAAGTTQGVRLHSVPASLLAKARYTVPAVPSIKPALVAGVGANFFQQSANDSEFSSSYVIPAALLGFSITLFDPGISPTDWFGGFNFGLTYAHGFASENRMRTLSFDLGLVVIL